MAKNQTKAEGKKKTSVGKIILYIIGGLIALSIISSIFGDDSDTTDVSNNDTNTQTEQESEEITYTEVNIKDFVQAYDDNDVTANKKYEDTYVKMTGYIGDISEDILGNVYVVVEPTNDDWYIGTAVQCYVVSDDEVYGIKSGDKITFQGQVDQFDIFNIELEDCTIL
jgi:hypothetical protein